MTHALAPDPFAPLSSDETDTAVGEVVAAGEDLVPVIPVPEDAPAAQFRHRELGEPTTVWAYIDQAGHLLGHVARFDTPTGKQILPRTWCRLPDRSCAWRWRAFSAPRPLYGLDRLAARPDAPVLVVEGEKTADAAQQHFPDHVAMAWPGGSNAYGKADWSPLADRRVIVWPDADQSGRKAAGEIAKLTSRRRVGLCSFGARQFDQRVGSRRSGAGQPADRGASRFCAGAHSRVARRLHDDEAGVGLARSVRRRETRSVACRPVPGARRNAGRRREVVGRSAGMARSRLSAALFANSACHAGGRRSGCAPGSA